MLSCGTRQSKPVLVKYRASNIYVLITASFSVFTGMVIYSIIIPIIPFMIDSMHKGMSLEAPIEHSAYSDSHVSPEASRDAGILFALYSVACGIGSPIFGYLGDKATHRRIPMLLGILTLFGANFIFLFATKYWMLAIARILQGLSDGCVWTLSLALISDTFPENILGTQTGRVLMFHMVGTSSGAPIGEALYHNMGYRAPFIFCIILSGVDFIFRFFLIERRNNPKHWFETIDLGLTKAREHVNVPLDNPEKRAPDVGEVVSIHSVISAQHASPIHNEQSPKESVSTARMLRDSRLLTALLLTFLHGFATGALEPVLPIHLSNEFGYNPSQIGLIYLAQVVPTIFGSPLSGRIYDKYGAKTLCSSSLFISAVALGLMGIPPNTAPGGPIPLIVITSIFGFFVSMIYPPAYPEITGAVKALAGSDGNETSAKSYGIANVTYCIGNLAGPLFTGFLYGTIGFFWLCIMTACIMLASAPFALIYLGEKHYHCRL
ncbi:major facilitator superfamily domain-containing protein [Fennellomyces sp. T-0311]|nr:major facilitator superfamily domain-containing protein [Fennellomyces sp. T-0311]